MKNNIVSRLVNFWMQNAHTQSEIETVIGLVCLRHLFQGRSVSVRRMLKFVKETR